MAYKNIQKSPACMCVCMEVGVFRFECIHEMWAMIRMSRIIEWTRISTYIFNCICVFLWILLSDWVCPGGQGHFSEWQNDARQSCTHKPHPYLGVLISQPRSLFRAMTEWQSIAELIIPHAMNTSFSFILLYPTLSQLSLNNKKKTRSILVNFVYICVFK